MAYRYNWTDDCCESGVAPCNTDILNENLMHLKYDIFEKIAEEGITISDAIEAIYPVGAIYIGTMAVCPIQALGIGTWELKSMGRVLQGSDGVNSAKTILNAGLPNITGELAFGNIANISFPYAVTNATGAFYGNGVSQVAAVGTRSVSGLYSNSVFDASRANSIYGNSATVQPPAYVVNIWERVA